MDYTMLCKWLVCLMVIIAVILLALSFAKLNKKKKPKQMSARRNAASPAADSGCAGIVDSKPPNCMEDNGVNLFGKPCCKYSPYDDAQGVQHMLPMQVFVGTDNQCVCLAPTHPECGEVCNDACMNDDYSMNQECLAACQSVCGQPLN